MGAINLDFDMELVVLEQRRRQLTALLNKAGKLARVRESYRTPVVKRCDKLPRAALILEREAPHLRELSLLKPHRFIQECLRLRNHPRTPDRVISCSFFRPFIFGNDVRTVERVV